MNFIIFDLEATCKENDRQFKKETIEIGAVKVSKVNGELKIVDEFNAFIRPIKNPTLTEFCKNLTKISQEDVDNADLFPSVIQSFKEWINIDEPYVLCSWGHYDKHQLLNDNKLHGLKDSKWITNHHISLKHQHGEILNKRPMGIQKALKIANMTFEGTHHRGIDDARNISRIFIKYFDKWIY